MGAVLTASFEFDVPVRFDIDRLDIELTSFDAAEAPTHSVDRGARMRTLDLGFKTHIESGATTLATCWKIVRRDEVVLGFTDHDQALSFGGTDYLPRMLDGGEAPARLGAQIDTGEVIGVLRSDAISEDDIAAGLYDGAEVETWRVNWRDVSQRLLLRRATIGEIVREDGRVSRRAALGAAGAEPGARADLFAALRCGAGRCAVRRVATRIRTLRWAATGSCRRAATASAMSRTFAAFRTSRATTSCCAIHAATASSTAERCSS